MLKLKEQSPVPESKDDQEALGKIEKLKNNSPERILGFFPEIKKENLKDWEEKRRTLGMEAVDTGKDKYFEDLYETLYEQEFEEQARQGKQEIEITTEVDELNRKFLKKFKPEFVRKMRNLIKERFYLDKKMIEAVRTKSAQEILTKAKNGYDFLIQKASTPGNFKEKIYILRLAYDGAKTFLDHKRQEETSQLIFDEYLKNAHLFTREDRIEIFGLIYQLLEKKEKDKALELAQAFEKAGLLDIEKDKYIFDKLTK